MPGLHPGPDRQIDEEGAGAGGSEQRMAGNHRRHIRSSACGGRNERGAQSSSLAAETNAEAMMEPLVGFVERSASAMLWPRDATEVHSLLASGRSEAAIDLYFAKVGDRWDCQQLHREVVELE